LRGRALLYRFYAKTQEYVANVATLQYCEQRCYICDVRLQVLLLGCFLPKLCANMVNW
jgi:hypothetical protein